MPNADSFDVQDTIAALATATGQGGVGIIRVSGPDALSIAQSVIGFQPTPRHAHFTEFFDDQGLRIDQGIALFFEGPNSFTGEDVFELQGHGGPVVMDILLRTVVSKGARIAEPGEFSKRAFLNDKLDLVQAEAIADLISSTSEQAARCAMRSLQGQFSKEIENVVAKLIKLRMFVEAAIDFPEEEIDFIADSNVLTDLDEIKQELLALLENANQGSLMTEGVKVVIAGRPNAGKSSLLNALAGRETAIVTDIAGTTRDVLKEQIHIDGMPLHLVDTAGLRDSDDEVERIGIERAWTEINEADIILLVHDAREAEHPDQIAWQNDFIAHIQRKDHLTLIRNKVDLVGAAEAFDQVCVQGDNLDRLSISAKQMIGIDLLRDHLKKMVGFKSNSEGMFTARRRHLDALESALDLMEMGRSQLVINQAGELLAEDLRQAQEALGTITGKFSADDLLGEIFGTFCIGK